MNSLLQWTTLLILLFQANQYCHSQKLIIEIQNESGTTTPEMHWDHDLWFIGELIDEVKTYNYKIGLSSELFKIFSVNAGDLDSLTSTFYGNLRLKSELGSASHDFHSHVYYNTSTTVYSAQTDYEYIDQYYFGLYPELRFGMAFLDVAFGIGPNLYIIQSTQPESNFVATHFIDERRLPHPEIDQLRWGLNYYLNVSIKYKSVALTVGAGYRNVRLFEQLNYFPGYSLRLPYYNLGVSYFI